MNKSRHVFCSPGAYSLVGRDRYLSDSESAEEKRKQTPLQSKEGCHGAHS